MNSEQLRAIAGDVYRRNSPVGGAHEPVRSAAGIDVPARNRQAVVNPTRDGHGAGGGIEDKEASLRIPNETMVRTTVEERPGDGPRGVNARQVRRFASRRIEPDELSAERSKETVIDTILVDVTPCNGSGLVNARVEGSFCSDGERHIRLSKSHAECAQCGHCGQDVLECA